MDELYRKSCKVLELPQVLERAAHFAATPEGKEKLYKLEPFNTFEEVQRELKETSAAKKLMETLSYPSFSGVRNVSAALKRAERGGILTAKELLDICSLLKAARLVREYSAGDKKEDTVIDYLFYGICGNKYLETKISDSIISEDEISDNASAELKDIRRRIKLAGDKAREVLNKIISSPSFQKVLQDPIVTIRQNRFVVPVKAECKGSIPGLVHDVSSSGATMFVEPLQVVELNNEIKLLSSKEEKEIERILYEMSAEAGNFADSIIRDYEQLVRLDFIFAKAKYSWDIKASEPVVCGEGGNVLELKNARHPLIDRKTAVPINLSIGKGYDTVVITGPNTGGKTVSLKTAGLLTVMTMCGLHIPADELSRVSVPCSVYADIGDEQSIEQSLSTFSSHMKNIVKITETVGKKSLVLFDELGAGTDPIEGAGLAIAVIEYVRRRGALVMATTHYAELKMYALRRDGVINGSCEFDVNTLKPTYKLVMGVPGKSNAFAISERLGLSPDIIDMAKENVSEENKRFDEIIEDLEDKRHEMENLTSEARLLKEKAAEEEEEIKSELIALDSQREELLAQAREEAKKIIEDAKNRTDAMMSELKAIKKRLTKGESSDDLNKAGADLRGKLNRHMEQLGQEKADARSVGKSSEHKGIKMGDMVFLPGTASVGEVVSIDNGYALVQAGIVQVKVKLSELEYAENAVKPSENEPKRTKMQKHELNVRDVSMELDLRGFTADDAIAELERFIDSAVMGKLTSVTIIHGKGTGALRSAVHSWLKRQKYVRSFRLGTFGEGEMGVTIVEL